MTFLVLMYIADLIFVYNLQFLIPSRRKHRSEQAVEIQIDNRILWQHSTNQFARITLKRPKAWGLIIKFNQSAGLL